MKKIRKIAMLTVVIALMAAMTIPMVGCANEEDAETYLIGINHFGQANFFAREGKEAMEDELRTLGIEFIASVTDNVPARVAAIESKIAQGVNAIIIQEGSIDDIEPVLREAHERGIIIGSMDAGVADFIDFYVASDNTALGTVVAQKMIDEMGGRGNVVVIYNDAGWMIRLRRDALLAVMENYPDVQITHGLVYPWPDFFESIVSQMESVLLANPNPGDISGVFATFDGVALAATHAIREAGLENYIVVVGVDGDPDAYVEMAREDSPFVGTMAQDPGTMARKVVNVVVDILGGNRPDSNEYLVPGILITRDNIPND